MGNDVRIGQTARSVDGCKLFVCWMEALSARSDHCRAIGYRIRGVTVVLGEINVARVKPKARPG